MCSKRLVDNKVSLHMGKHVSKRKLGKKKVECNGHTNDAQHLVKYLGLTLDDQLTGRLLLTILFKKSMVGLNFFKDNSTFRDKT